MLLKTGLVFFHWAVEISCQESRCEVVHIYFHLRPVCLWKKIVLGFFLQNAGLMSVSYNGIMIIPGMVDIALTGDGLLVQNKSSILPSRVGSRCIWEIWWSRNSCTNFSHAVFVRDDGRTDSFSHSISPKLKSAMKYNGCRQCLYIRILVSITVLLLCTF